MSQLRSFAITDCLAFRTVALRALRGCADASHAKWPASVSSKSRWPTVMSVAEPTTFVEV